MNASDYSKMNVVVLSIQSLKTSDRITKIFVIQK
jgi:hypothetical protein